MALIRIDKTGANTHLESIVIMEDGVPNGALVSVGAYSGFDAYLMTKPNVVATEDIVFINEPFINYTGYETETTMTFKANKVVRAYRFIKDDMITISIDGITNATNVSVDMVGKFVVPATTSYLPVISATKVGLLAFKVIAVETLHGQDALVLKVA